MYISEPEKSIPVVLDLFDEFSDLSGYKINWGKSAMMQLNAQSTLSNLSVNIPIKKQFTYLGIDIQPDVNNIVKSDYEKLFRDIERDLERWTVLPASLMSWIATLKMNVLPRLSFLCAMIPLPPQIGYGHKVDVMIQKYLWNGGHPKIKLSKLQIFKENGGLSVPDFKLYFMSYQLRAIQTWLNPHSLAPWRDIEAELVKPYRLQDILLSGLFLRKYALNFGNIITSTISNFRGTEKKLSILTNGTYIPQSGAIITLNQVVDHLFQNNGHKRVSITLQIFLMMRDFLVLRICEDILTYQGPPFSFTLDSVQP